jgi:hypothetical protein
MDDRKRVLFQLALDTWNEEVFVEEQLAAEQLVHRADFLGDVGEG